MIRLKKQVGLTLVELMVTLAISSVVLAGVVKIYTSSLTQAKITTNLSSMQESGRFALELLSRDIRMAGYTGCLNYDQASGSESIYLIYKRASDNNAMLGLVGKEWTSTGYASSSLTPMVTASTSPIGTSGGSWVTSGGATLATNYSEAIANSDVLQVWTTGESAIDGATVTPAASAIDVTVDKGHGIKAGDVLMLANCGSIIVAQVCSVTDTQLSVVSGGSDTCNNSFSTTYDISKLKATGVGAYDKGYEVFSFRDATYFVGKRDTGSATPPSLFRGVNGVSKEMVEGVENMQILYGVDDGHDEGDLRTPDKYVPADQVGSRWSDVVAIRVSVLMRSFEKVMLTKSPGVYDSYTFSFNGKTYTATDGYLRQSYSTTIALRNRNGGEVKGLFSTTSP